MARPLANPVVRGRADRALSQAQTALGELITYGANATDRGMALELWDQIEKMRNRLKGGK